MADYFWGRIQIGGNLRRVHSAQFCRVFGTDSERGLLDHMENDQLVKVESEARFGQFEELETLCRGFWLPYIRQSDGKYECSPEIVFWEPGMIAPCRVITDHDGNMQVDMDTVRAIRDALAANEILAARCLADRAMVELPSLPPFRVV